MYPIALLVALAGALVFATVAYDRDHPTSRLGGDYPAFFGAGQIVSDGDWEEVYSAERQQAGVHQAGAVHLFNNNKQLAYFSHGSKVWHAV